MLYGTFSFNPHKNLIYMCIHTQVYTYIYIYIISNVLCMYVVPILQIRKLRLGERLSHLIGIYYY